MLNNFFKYSLNLLILLLCFDISLLRLLFFQFEGVLRRHFAQTAFTKNQILLLLEIERLDDSELLTNFIQQLSRSVIFPSKTLCNLIPLADFCYLLVGPHIHATMHSIQSHNELRVLDAS
jgi:hypothetical protein